MAKPFKNNDKKNANSANMFERPRDRANKLQKRLTDQERREKMKIWTTFYRRNVHRFVEHYLNINIHFYQKIMLYVMSVYFDFVCIASRGSAKSFIIALFACCRAILYPNSKIVIVSGTKGQGGLIVSEKIQKELYPASYNLQREIKKINTSLQDTSVEFWNGSTIKVVPASENARGNRSTFIIYEEFRLIPKNIIDTVISPFAFSRQAPYLMNPEYSSLAEEPISVYISSAHYKSHEYMWKLIKDTASSMLNNGDRCILAFDYLLSMHHGLKTARQIAKEKNDLSDIAFEMEYRNLMYGENENSFFKLDDFRINQTIKTAFYPLRPIDIGLKRKDFFDYKKTKGEIRLVTCDIAMREGDGNDNTALICIRLLPESTGYRREVVYIETMNGVNSIIQALRIKRLYADFDADYIVLDIKNQGINIYDQLGVITKDEERGVEHPAFTCYQDDEELRKRTLAINAEKNVYCITGSASLNTEIITALKDTMKKHMISFLVDYNDAVDTLLSIKEYKDAYVSGDIEMQNFYEHPYAQTQQLINECVNLTYTMNGGNIKIEEPADGRKDRYSSLAYGNYFAGILEKKNLREANSDDWAAAFVASKRNNQFLEGYY